MSKITQTLSFWERSRFFSEKDFIIIGAGLTGLWCAYEIKKKFPDQSVLILERGIVPSGASSKNAGFACFGSPTELLSETKTAGWEPMLKTVEMRYKGIKKIKETLDEKLIGYDPCGGYECIDKKIHNISDLKSNVDFLNHQLASITGLAETFSWSNSDLKKFGLKNFDGLIKNNIEAGLDSGLLLKTLALKVQEMGAEILYSVDVVSFVESQNGVRINTTTERDFYFGRRMIVCTNAFIPQLLPGFEIKPARGQMMITNPIPGLALKGTFHFNEGYYYFRNVGDRLLIGGARNKDFSGEETRKFITTSIIQDELDGFLKKHVGSSVSVNISTRWSGIMGFTANKEPVISNPFSCVYAVACCNGMGIALSPIIAEELIKQL